VSVEVAQMPHHLDRSFAILKISQDSCSEGF
jgi:hypothetical protein